jgi:hypothetical protein
MKKIYSLEYFFEKSWSFVLIKNGKIIYKSKAQRLRPLVFCLKKYNRQISGTVVFDKIVGRAAAYLLARARVAEVRTPTISRDAKRILSKNKIKIAFGREVKNIMNRRGDDLCPMEKLSGKLGEKEFVKFILEK